MRETMFRGKRTYDNEWTYGSLVIIENIDGEKIFSILKSDGTGQYVIEESIGEYTGLKDRNNKMIFEGDIIYFTDKSLLWRVCWNDYKWSLIDATDNLTMVDFRTVLSKDCEVVSNSYDNLERLEVKDERN